MSIRKRFVASAIYILLAICFAFSPSAVYADTQGTEIKIADQPDKLVLELGNDWSGAEFELKLDSGTFPVPVIANDAGVLTMDLGGSKVYTLKLLTPTPVVALPTQTEKPEEPAASAAPAESPSPTPAPTNAPPMPAADRTADGIPTAHLLLFIGGLIVAVGALVAMHVLKKRREYYDDNDYGDDEDE